MLIKIVKNKITLKELLKMAKEGFGDLIKAVVDVEKEIMAMGGELHSDEEILLIEKEGSRLKSTWGINIYPDKPEDEWIDFDSLINLKPSLGNRSRQVESQEIKEKIKRIVKKLIGN